MKPLQGTGRPIQGLLECFEFYTTIIFNIIYINYVYLKIIDYE